MTIPFPPKTMWLAMAAAVIFACSLLEIAFEAVRTLSWFFCMETPENSSQQFHWY